MWHSLILVSDGLWEVDVFVYVSCDVWRESDSSYLQYFVENTSLRCDLWRSCMDLTWDKVISAVYIEREKMQNHLSSEWRPPSKTSVQLNRTATESHKNKWCRTDERETWHHTDGRNDESSMLDRDDVSSVVVTGFQTSGYTTQERWSGPIVLRLWLIFSRTQTRRERDDDEKKIKGVSL